MEMWLPVVGYESLYRVSDHGRVWSEPRVSGGKPQGRQFREGRILRKSFDRDGYPRYSLSRGDGTRRHKTLHTLVLTAFVGRRPEGMEACHNDGDPANCSLTNLRWDTHRSNLRDKVRHGTDVQATHCPRGHEYRSENLSESRPSRYCLACSRAHNRLCRGVGCDHESPEFQTASDWYYANLGLRWVA